ncbi:hypothetical protein BC830DRAFT_892291 [Chytriomyces sp. MP71]|nr:hypothetical protein BC830DRAFT_892291 [Chytriomyces sp. MP71]
MIGLCSLLFVIITVIISRDTSRTQLFFFSFSFFFCFCTVRSHFDLSAADFISFKTEKRFEILVPRTEPQIHTSMTHVHPHSNAAAVPAAAARTAPHSMFETPLATRPASSGSRNQRHRTHSQHSQHKHKLPVKAAPESCRNKAAGRSAKKHHPRDNLYQNKHSLQKRNSANKHINSTSSSATSTTGKRTSSHARKLKWADKQALEAAIRRSRRATSLGASAAPSSEPHLDLARDSLHLLMREAFATCPPEGPISREDLLFHDSFYRGAGELQSYGPADSYTPYCQSFHAPPSPNVPKVPSTMQERHEYSYDSDDLDADQYMSDCSSSDSSSRSLNHKEDDVDEFDLGREIDEACNDLDLTPSDEEDQEDMNGPKSPPFNFGSTPVYMDPYASFDLNDASSPPPYLFSFPRCLSLSLSFRLASLACTFSPFRARD